MVLRMRFVPTPPLLLYRRFARSINDHGLRGALVRSWQRLTRSLSNHGLSGTLERAFIKAPGPAHSKEWVEARPPSPFDVAHGTDTSGYISGAELQSVSMSAVYITAYAGIQPSVLTQALSNLPISPEKFTFIDLGCGKGRALFLAAQFPFPHLIGVELATDLCRIAQTNIATNPDWASRIVVLNKDATTFNYPDGPLLIYLFHPFLAPILRRVLANLERQLRHSPREIYVLYARNPRFEVLQRFPFLREISETSYPLSPDEVAADYFQMTEESFTLYSVDLTRLK
jgi:SAM-dependent methyltransferase